MTHVLIYLRRLIEMDEIDKKLEKMFRDPIHIRIKNFALKLIHKFF